jgi:hypothetical protein
MAGWNKTNIQAEPEPTREKDGRSQREEGRGRPGSGLSALDLTAPQHLQMLNFCHLPPRVLSSA